MGLCCINILKIKILGRLRLAFSSLSVGVMLQFWLNRVFGVKGLLDYSLGCNRIGLSSS